MIFEWTEQNGHVDCFLYFFKLIWSFTTVDECEVSVFIWNLKFLRATFSYSQHKLLPLKNQAFERSRKKGPFWHNVSFGDVLTKGRTNVESKYLTKAEKSDRFSFSFHSLPCSSVPWKSMRIFNADETCTRPREMQVWSTKTSIQ